MEDIETISGTIDKVSEIATAIASAVEQQTVANSEISVNFQTAAKNTAEVSSGMTHIRDKTETTRLAAEGITSEAFGFKRQVDQLRTDVKAFFDKVLAG
ncbi:hypothetical protein [Breoghania sp.]|uniref:hypothetical protein n=1 Tax=Breoghania sp. TaxID=2065378 RepID=UPI0026274B8B|nr:hypothetical protein [Breoghania sp.]MDJ0931476.1 hypothetical protein [Breoghania sp.]